MDKNIKRLDIAAMASMFVYASSATILPISLVQISKELSLNLTQGGFLGFFSSILQFVVLLISSFLAGKLGKLKILRTSILILSFGLFIFTKSTSYLLCTFLILFIGVGQGFLEALLTPLVDDIHPGDSGKKMNLLHAFWPIGVSFSVLIFGELLSQGYSWRLIFIVLSIAVLVVYFIYPSNKSITLPKSSTNFKHMGDILNNRRFWLFGFSLFFAGGAEGSFAFWSASYIQLEFNTAARAGAVGTALFAFGMVVGRLLTSKLTEKFKLKNILITTSILAFIFSIFFYYSVNIQYIFILIFIMGLTIAALWPSIQSYSGLVMQVDKTMLMIFLSCFGLPGYSSATLLMGIIGDNYGLRSSFLVSPIYLLLLVIVFF